MKSKKSRFSKFGRFWKLLGPGLVTGASDDDPSGIATYSQAGAAYGLSTLWTALIAFPLMASIQQMCAKIGLVTSQGLTGTLKKYYPRPVLYLMLLFSFPAIVLNIGADIAGMGAVGNLLFPAVDATYFSVIFTIMLLGLIIYLPYQKIAAVLKYMCIVLLVYLIVPFLYSGLVMFFIILTTGTVLFKGGIHQIDTVEQAALALKPLAGNLAYLLFAIGVIGTGLIAIPVLSGSLSYIITETFGWEQGLDKKFHEAKAFYVIIAISLLLGLSLNYVGISPIKALIYTAILYGLTAPVLIAIILHISNNKKIMGDHVNGRTLNIMGFAALIIMSAAAVVLLYLFI